MVAATCSSQFGECPTGVLVEPSDTLGVLSDGLLVAVSLVKVVRGTVYVPVVNVGCTTVALPSRCPLGVLTIVQVVSLPAGVTEEVSDGPAVMVAQVQAHVAQSSPILEQIGALDLSVLSSVDQGRVRSLLRKHAAVFSSFEGDIGCTGLISHDIPLLDDIPIRQRYRRIPPSDYDSVKAHIRQLLENQVIQESCSLYASPIVLVKKKDGSLRMCVVYRQLNNKTRKDAFPLPWIEETALSGAQWFSTMDLASGYNQIPVTEDQHLSRLELVLNRLGQAGLKAKLKKCCFFRRQVRYLGHLVSDKGVSTDLEKEQDGRVRPVAYASRSLNPNEKLYSSMKLEFLGLKWAMTEKFREYLWGQECIVWTDNNPLSHLKTAKLGATEQRWVAQLSAFHYTIHYRPGHVNKNADSLSRQKVSTPEELQGSAVGGVTLPLAHRHQAREEAPLQPVAQLSISVFPSRTVEELKRLQEADLGIGPFISFWQECKQPSRSVREGPKVFFDNGIELSCIMGYCIEKF
ncbi:hypothetical protein SRHO_G00103200 [Serrasalmus rhombeus]